MTATRRAATERGRLLVALDGSRVPVSYVSSLLRVLQAALREVGHADEATRGAFEGTGPPILLMSADQVEEELALAFHFAGSTDGVPMDNVSALVFDAFLDRLSEYVRGLPQPSLFGGAAAGAPRRESEDAMTRRMDQVHRELRRSPRVTLSTGGKSLRIEGQSMEIA